MCASTATPSRLHSHSRVCQYHHHLVRFSQIPYHVAQNCWQNSATRRIRHVCQTEDWEPEGRCMLMRSPRALVGGVGFDVRAGMTMGGILVDCEGTGSSSAVWIASGQDEGCTVTANGPLHPLVCILRSTRVQEACPPPVVRTLCLGGCVLASTAATSRSHSRSRICQLHHHLVCFSHLRVDADWAGGCPSGNVERGGITTAYRQRSTFEVFEPSPPHPWRRWHLASHTHVQLYTMRTPLNGTTSRNPIRQLD